jgi:hypothetical protein
VNGDDENDSSNERNEHPNGHTNEHQSRQLVCTDHLHQAVSSASPTLAEQTMDDVWNSLEGPLLVDGGSSSKAGSYGHNSNSDKVIPPSIKLSTISSTTSLQDASYSNNDMICRLVQLGSLWKGLVPKRTKTTSKWPTERALEYRQLSPTGRLH